MKSIFALLALLGLTAGLSATPWYDASGYADNSSSLSVNCSGTYSTYLVVAVQSDGSNWGGVSGVYYGTQTMTSQVVESGLSAKLWMYTLAAPATGSNTLAVVFSMAPSDYHVSWASYDGASIIGNTGGTYASNTSITYGGINSGSIGVYLGEAYGSAPVLTASGLTSRQNYAGGVNVWELGDTVSTSEQTISATDPVSYTIMGGMVELYSAVTPTYTVSPTFTPSPSFTASPSVTKTFTVSDTPTITPTPTKTATATDTPSDTATPTLTATISPTFTASPTATATDTPSATATSTPAPPPVSSSLQLQDEYAPYTKSWVVSSLNTSTTWASAATGCAGQPCVILLGNPALTPGEDEYYSEALPGVQATQTPSVNGIPLAPGAATKLYGAPGEVIWSKAAVTAQPASEMEVKQ